MCGHVVNVYKQCGDYELVKKLRCEDRTFWMLTDKCIRAFCKTRNYLDGLCPWCDRKVKDELERQARDLEREANWQAYKRETMLLDKIDRDRWLEKEPGLLRRMGFYGEEAKVQKPKPEYKFEYFDAMVVAHPAPNDIRTPPPQRHRSLPVSQSSLPSRGGSAVSAGDMRHRSTSSQRTAVASTTPGQSPRAVTPRPGAGLYREAAAVPRPFLPDIGIEINDGYSAYNPAYGGTATRRQLSSRVNAASTFVSGQNPLAKEAEEAAFRTTNQDEGLFAPRWIARNPDPTVMDNAAIASVKRKRQADEDENENENKENLAGPPSQPKRRTLSASQGRSSRIPVLVCDPRISSAPLPVRTLSQVHARILPVAGSPLRTPSLRRVPALEILNEPPSPVQQPLPSPTETTMAVVNFDPDHVGESPEPPRRQVLRRKPVPWEQKWKMYKKDRVNAWAEDQTRKWLCQQYEEEIDEQGRTGICLG